MRFFPSLVVILAGVLAGAPAALGDGPASPFAGFQRSATPYPDADPYSAAKAELGRDLFFDPLLSRSRTLSCSSCHNPGLSWGDGRGRAVGEGHADMALRSPTLIGVAWLDRLGWDGKFRSLESVAFAPLTTPGNMNMTEAEVVDRLQAVPDYGRAFTAAFGTPEVSRQRIERALATFERSILPGEAPFDRWAEGDPAAVPAAAKRGFALFTGKAGCAACHSGWTFSDGSFHDIGSATGDDLGRGRLFPTSTALRFAFKTPSLRDVARRAPYMHDGSVATLAEVIELYDRGGIARPSRSPEIRPLGLAAGEKADLLAFLATLSGAPEPASVPALPR